MDIDIKLDTLDKHSKDYDIIETVVANRRTARALLAEEKLSDALERTVDGLRTLRDFSNYENMEFRAVLASLLYDLAEVHYSLKDYKQSESELEILFKVLDPILKKDAERFGPAHILAMELSTRILRSRKKTLDLLAKQQLNASALYEKVTSGVAAATDKLVDSLCRVGELLASSGNYKSALKFYAEAIKFSKRRAGRVTRKEVKMTVDMARIMMRIKSQRPRARRLLNAILPHAIALETIELEEDILALIEVIDADIEREPLWKNFLHKLAIKK